MLSIVSIIGPGCMPICESDDSDQVVLFIKTERGEVFFPCNSLRNCVRLFVFFCVRERERNSVVELDQFPPPPVTSSIIGG